MDIWQDLRERLQDFVASSRLSFAKYWPGRTTAAGLYESLFKNDLKIDKKTGAAALFAAFAGFCVIFSFILDQNLNAALDERDAKAVLLSSLQKARLVQGELNGNNSAEADHRDPFIVAASETQAAAEIDSLLRKITIDANGTVLSSQSEAKQEEDKGPLRKIEATIMIEGKIETIQAALFAIETGSPFIFVDMLTLSPNSHASEGLSSTGAASNQAPLLRANLTTSAYWRNPS
jgi:general secretion pathway protein M